MKGRGGLRVIEFAEDVVREFNTIDLDCLEELCLGELCLVALLADGGNNLERVDHGVGKVEDPELHLVEETCVDEESLVRGDELEGVGESFKVRSRFEPRVAEETKGFPVVLLALLLDEQEAVVEEEELAWEELAFGADLLHGSLAHKASTWRDETLWLADETHLDLHDDVEVLSIADRCVHKVSDLTDEGKGAADVGVIGVTGVSVFEEIAEEHDVAGDALDGHDEEERDVLPGAVGKDRDDIEELDKVLAATACVVERLEGLVVVAAVLVVELEERREFSEDIAYQLGLVPMFSDTLFEGREEF